GGSGRKCRALRRGRRPNSAWSAYLAAVAVTGSCARDARGAIQGEVGKNREAQIAVVRLTAQWDEYRCKSRSKMTSTEPSNVRRNGWARAWMKRSGAGSANCWT